MLTISFTSFVFICTWCKKSAQNTGVELYAFPSSRPTSMTTESFSIKFCTGVHANIDRGSLILVRTGQTQANTYANQSSDPCNLGSRNPVLFTPHKHKKQKRQKHSSQFYSYYNLNFPALSYRASHCAPYH